MNDVLLVVVVAVALGFDFTNGFHDTANSIATAIGARAMSPRFAVLTAAAANLAGAFVTTAVAKTVAKGIIDANRFEALIRVAAEEGDSGRRQLTRRTAVCSCRRRPRRSCTRWQTIGPYCWEGCENLHVNTVR